MFPIRCSFHVLFQTFKASEPALEVLVFCFQIDNEFMGNYDFGSLVIERLKANVYSFRSRNIEITPNERIVQAWRVGQWPEGVYSIIKVELKAEGAHKTRLILDHTGYPQEAHDHLEEGWYTMYWTPLESYLES